jgi:hypothetical protein
MQQKGLHKALYCTHFICLRLCEKVVLSLILLFETGYERKAISSVDYSNTFHESSSVKHKNYIKATTPFITQAVICAILSHIIQLITTNICTVLHLKPSGRHIIIVPANYHKLNGLGSEPLSEKKLWVPYVRPYR